MSDLLGYLEFCRSRAEHGKLPEECENFPKEFPEEYKHALYDYNAALPYKLNNELLKTYDSNINPFSTQQTFTFSEFALAADHLREFQERYPKHRISQSIAQFHALDDFMSFKEWAAAESVRLSQPVRVAGPDFTGTEVLSIDDPYSTTYGERYPIDITQYGPITLAHLANWGLASTIDEWRLQAQALPSNLQTTPALHENEINNACMLVEDENGNQNFYLLNRPLYTYQIFENPQEFFSKVKLNDGLPFRPIALFTSDGQELEIAMQPVGEDAFFHRKARILAEITWEPGNRFVPTEAWALQYTPQIQALISEALQSSAAGMRLHESTYLLASPEELARIVDQLIHAGTSNSLPLRAVADKIVTMLEKVFEYSQERYNSLVNHVSSWDELYKKLDTERAARLTLLLSKSSRRSIDHKASVDDLKMSPLYGIKDELAATVKTLSFPDKFLASLGWLFNCNYIALTNGQISAGWRMVVNARENFSRTADKGWEIGTEKAIAAEQFGTETENALSDTGKALLRSYFLYSGYHWLTQRPAGQRATAAISRFTRNQVRDPKSIISLGAFIGLTWLYNNKIREDGYDKMKPWEQDLAWCIEEGIMELGDPLIRLQRKTAHADGRVIRPLAEYKAADIDWTRDLRITHDKPWYAHLSNFFTSDDTLNFRYDEGVRRFRKEFTGKYTQVLQSRLIALAYENVKAQNKKPAQKNTKTPNNEIDRASYEEAVWPYVEQNSELIGLIGGPNTPLGDMGIAVFKVNFTRLYAWLDGELRVANQASAQP